MAPEYGATCDFFGIDDKTLDYMRLTGRSEENIALVETYPKAQGLWRHAGMPDPVFTDTLDLDMASVVPSLAGPNPPQDTVVLTDVDALSTTAPTKLYGTHKPASAPVPRKDHDTGHPHAAPAPLPRNSALLGQ